MSYATKQVLLKNFEKRAENSLTVSSLNEIMNILAEELNHYDVTETDVDNHDYIDLLSMFIDAKRIEGRSEKTLAHYNYIIKRMMEEIKTPIKSITVYHLRSYLMQMKTKGISDKTIEGVRSVLSSFFIWLQKEGLLPSNPCANLNTIKCIKKVRHPFSDVDIAKLKDSCSTTRDKCLISFLLATGCRISEACELNYNQIDFQNLECVVHGKGNKERTVYIDSVTAMLLKRYLTERKDNSPALFIGKGSTRMTPGGIRFRLRSIAKNAGVDNVHPHRFRRTLATNLINRGMPIQEVAEILGHDKIDTTMRYVFIQKNNVKNAYKKYA